MELSLPVASAAAFSPNGDGVQDELVIEPSVRPAAGRVIKSFELLIYGASPPAVGELVWSFRVSEPRNRGALGDLFRFGAEPAVEVPSSVTWDGTYRGSSIAADGVTVPDGQYVYQLSFTDDRDAIRTTAPVPVIVDTVPPLLTLQSLSPSVISPDGDGVRDELVVEQSGSVEANWIGTVASAAGEVVARYLVAGGPAARFVWDGRNADGDTVEDGEYTYSLLGQDAAGNQSMSDPIAFRVSTAAGSVLLDPVLAWVSPDGDRVQDTIEFTTTVTDPDGVAGWRLEVRATTSATPLVYQDAGSGLPPAVIPFAAIGNVGGLSIGGSLPEGVYEAQLLLAYENGLVARSGPARVAVDTTAPAGTLSLSTEPEPLDPDVPARFGGLSRPRLRVGVDLDAAEWTVILSADGEELRLPLTRDLLPSIRFREDRIQGELVWGGEDPRGGKVPDGLLTLRLEATDAAGNPGQTNELRIVRDTRAASVSLSADVLHISPNADGVTDGSILTTSYEPRDGIAEFLLSISDPDGRIVRTEYRRTPFSSFEWLGRTNSGGTLRDGEYTASLEVRYANGTTVTDTAGPIVLDRTPPRVLELSVPYRLFSPDGDGEREQVAVTQDATREQLWTGTIAADDGTVVREFAWEGVPTPFSWDGRDAAGRLVPDGDYVYELASTDQAGNQASADLTLIIDTASLPVSQQPPALALAVSPSPFTPDGDGTDDEVIFTPRVDGPNAIAGWEIAIRDPFGQLMRRIRGSGMPGPVSWDGRSARGELVQSAQEYRATLTVTDEFGNRADADAAVAVGILVMREGLLLRIMIPSISFAPYTADLFAIEDEELQRNLETLRSLSEVLKRYPEREILIEGHAAHDTWEEGPAKQREQREELIPLSAARAQEVRQALIILGIEPDRMRTEGVGGARPVVPHADRENIWKNRRVEFILERR